MHNSLPTAETALSRRQLLALAGSSTLAGLLLASCGSTTNATTSDQQLAPQVRLGFQPANIAAFVLQEQKLLEQTFKDSSTKIEYRRLLAINPILEGIVGKSLDLGVGGTPIGAIAAGQPLRMIALFENSPSTHAVLVRPGSNIKKPEDLKGKKVATSLGKFNTFLLRVLERAKLGVDDIEWVKIENIQGRSALLTGAVDAWQTWDPFYASAILSKEAVELINSGSYIQNYSTLFGHKEYVEKYPNTVKLVLKAYKKAIEHVQTHRDEAIDLVAKQNKISHEVAEITLSRRKYQISAPTPAYFEDITYQSKLLQRIGLIKQVPDWEKIVDTKIAQEALA